jgi:sugar lactone lactonase YvrE
VPSRRVAHLEFLVLHKSPRCGSTLMMLTVLGLTAVSASAQTLEFRTLAGRSPAGNFDGTGSAARFNGPTSVAVDGAGTLYIADQQNCLIRKITAAGAVTTFAGGVQGASPCGSADGAGNIAQFKFATGVALDSTGNLYVADTNNHTIRQITPAGVVTTIAGLAGSPGSADGAGSAARFNSPTGIAVDGAGNVFVADTNNHAIRQITSAGVVTTVVGLTGSPGSVDGTGSGARFNGPCGIAVDNSGNVYVADSNNHTIRRIAAGGVVTTLAGTAGLSGNIDATGSAARFFNPRGIAVDADGTLYVADTNNHQIRRVGADGVVTTLAGSGQAGGSDGPSGDARFNHPEGVTVDAGGVIFVADTANDAIRKITGGVVTTIAGFGESFGSADGFEQAARFAHPSAIAVDLHTSLTCLPLGGLRENSLYVADRDNNTIRQISLAGFHSGTMPGVVSTVAGSVGNPGSADGPGSAARFNSPRAVAVDNSPCTNFSPTRGALYVADGGNHTVRMLKNGVVTTLAGLAGTSGSSDGTGSDARFNEPSGIAVDNSTGVVYVADSANHTIRKIEPGGIVTTIAGLAGTSGIADGAGSTARFNNPTGLTVDATGIVYIADTNNHTIRSMTAAGVVTTLAGLAGSPGSNDGAGTAARFSTPQGIAVDYVDSYPGPTQGWPIYVADTGNHTIRRITAGNVVTTIAPCRECFGEGNDGRFNTPEGIAVDSQGSLYVADGRNNTIRTTAAVGPGLLVDFGPAYGIWLRRGTVWRQVIGRSAKGLIPMHNGSDDALIVDFGPGELGPGVGIWLYQQDPDRNESWIRIHRLSADLMVGIDSNGDGETDSVVFSFAGQGLWLFNRDTNDWAQLHTANPLHLTAANLDGVGGDELIMDFAGYGLWVYSAGVWSQLHALTVSTMTTADMDGNGQQDLIVNFPGYGVWEYANGTTWSLIHPFDAQRIAGGHYTGSFFSELIIDFGPGIGLWHRFQIGAFESWDQISALTTENIVASDLDSDGVDELIADFGAAGMWLYQRNQWTYVHGLNPNSMAMGRVR